jgi:hypothetical protein
MRRGHELVQPRIIVPEGPRQLAFALQGVGREEAVLARESQADLERVAGTSQVGLPADVQVAEVGNAKAVATDSTAVVDCSLSFRETTPQRAEAALSTRFASAAPRGAAGRVTQRRTRAGSSVGSPRLSATTGMAADEQADVPAALRAAEARAQALGGLGKFLGSQPSARQLEGHTSALLSAWEGICAPCDHRTPAFFGQPGRFSCSRGSPRVAQPSGSHR